MLSVRIIDLVGFFLAGPCRIANTPCLDQGGAKQLKIEIMFNCILWATRPALITPYSHMDCMSACRTGQDGPSTNN